MSSSPQEEERREDEAEEEEGEEMEQEEEPQEEYPEARQADNWNKDVNETGRWGTLSRREVIIVVLAVCLIVVAVIVSVVLAIVLDEEEKGSEGDGIETGATLIVDGQRVSAYQLPTPPTPTLISDPLEKLNFLRSELSKEPVMAQYLEFIPTSVEALQGQTVNILASPYFRAASWLVTVDTNNVLEEAITRYGLAVIYYQTNGEQWTNSTNWLMSDKRHCDWHGVACCTGVMQFSLQCTNSDFYDVIELDFYNNNLSGPIPESFVLFKKLFSLFLSENKMTGKIPENVFGNLTSFGKLYLQHNQLTGTIPEDLDDNNLLGTFCVSLSGLSGLGQANCRRYSSLLSRPLIFAIVLCSSSFLRQTHCICKGITSMVRGLQSSVPRISWAQAMYSILALTVTRWHAEELAAKLREVVFTTAMLRMRIKRNVH